MGVCLCNPVVLYSLVAFTPQFRDIKARGKLRARVKGYDRVSGFGLSVCVL